MKLCQPVIVEGGLVLRYQLLALNHSTLPQLNARQHSIQHTHMAMLVEVGYTIHE